MAINQNHLFEELDGTKCAIVEKNVTKERLEFLRSLLECNHYKVIIVPSPPPKGSSTENTTDSVEASVAQTQVTETFTVGVTDVTFNPVNAIFGRLLKTKEGNIVTLDYWKQKVNISFDDIPYFERRMD